MSSSTDISPSSPGSQIPCVPLLRESRWSKPGSGIKIVPILTAKETFSPGDAMRDIYTRGLVTSDFVLVMGDLVSNIRIDEVVRVHRERRKTDKNAIMTMVVKESGARHRTKCVKSRWFDWPYELNVTFGLEPEATLRYSYWTQRPRSACITNPSQDTLKLKSRTSHERSLLNIQKLRSGMT
jgi:hypothetical protein